jgi:cell division protein FtsL
MYIFGAYQKCGLLFKDKNKEVDNAKNLEVKKMVKLTKKSKIAIAALAAIVIVLVVTMPHVSAQTIANNAASNIKTLNARGNIYQKIDSSTIKYYQANLTLTLQPTSTSGNVKLFDVTGGILVTVNGASYSFASGNGGVLTGRHDVLMKADGTDANGQQVTLKLAGQYSYSWLAGKVALKIGATLQTTDANYTLLMLAPI